MTAAEPEPPAETAAETIAEPIEPIAGTAPEPLPAEPASPRTAE